MVQDRIVVIDTDTAMANLTVQQVIAMGVEEVKVSHDPEEGYQAIRSGQYTAAIIDWKLKGASNGLAVLSRIRRNPNFGFYPIIITAGFANKEDLRIIADYPCTVVMGKPLRAKEIAETITKLKSVSQWYTVNNKNIKDAFSSPSLTEDSAQKLCDLFLTKNPSSIPLAMLVAKYLLKHNFDALALNLCDKHLAQNSQNLAVLNCKSKILAKTGDMAGAIKTISMAQALSPHNLERLCLLGEIEISLNNPEAAIANFQKALAVEPMDTKAKVGLMMAGELSKGTLSGSSDGSSIAKMMNNLGAQLAANGQYQKAIKYYMLSFAFVGSQELQTRVSFNLGLSFKKWSKLPQAKFWLQKSLELSYGAFSKATRHLQGLEHIQAQAGFENNKPPEKKAAAPKKSSPAEMFLDMSPDPTPVADEIDASAEQFDEESIVISSSPPKPQTPESIKAQADLENVVEKLDTITSFDLDISSE